jgi:ribosomal protein S18 acetylase RimI-like enzyme
MPKSMNAYVRRKFNDRIRQYGFLAAMGQILRACVRPIYKFHKDLVFVVAADPGHRCDAALIKPFTQQMIRDAVESGELESGDAQLLAGFLDEGSRGICAEVDGRFAGYAWIQYSGEYRFGEVGRMTIPVKHVVIKNLWVLPDYRGRKLGQMLNAALLALIPPDHVAVIFIIPDNRYAIRNWERLGAVRVLFVKLSRWWSRPWKIELARLSERPETDVLSPTIRVSSQR